MKKYLKFLPVMLYPYAYIIWLIIFSGATKVMVDANVNSNIGYEITFLLALLYMGYTIVLVVMESVRFARNTEICGAAKINMIVKLVQIPAYIGHFIIGCIGVLMSVWGLGFIIVAIVVDALTIIHTGILAIGCMINMKKANVLTTKMAVLASIGSFIYCVDVVVAIAVFAMEKIKQKNIYLNL